MVKIIIKNIVKRKPGYLYYIDMKGNVCESKFGEIIKERKTIYTDTEFKAMRILNSKKFKHKWKKDFRIAYGTEDYDLINSEGIKIEVKSTINKYRYDGNYLTFNTPKQQKQIVMKFLLDKSGKLIKFGIIKKIKNKWKSLIIKGY